MDAFDSIVDPPAGLHHHVAVYVATSFNYRWLAFIPALLGTQLPQHCDNTAAYLKAMLK